MEPKGKVALLTGGARIGQVVAHSLAARGCDLALVYRASRDAAEALEAADDITACAVSGGLA